MSSQQRLNGSNQTVANELLLLRKLASLRRSASWKLTVERSRNAVAPLPKRADARSARFAARRAGTARKEHVGDLAGPSEFVGVFQRSLRQGKR